MRDNRWSRRSTAPLGRARGGFTLVEVLVVVGILILLISITVPVVSKARQQAAKTKCVNNLRGLGQAVNAFAGEHNATLPTCGASKPTYQKSTDWIGYGGIDSVRTTDYMNESGIAKYLGVTVPDQSGNPNEKLRNLYRCPSVSDEQRASRGFYPYDYQFNAQLSGLPIDRILRAGEKGLIVEDDNRDDSAYEWWGNTPAMTADTNSSTSQGATGGVDAVAVRHGGTGGNCLFADYHVGIMAPAVVPAPDPSVDYANWTNWDAYYTQDQPNTNPQAIHAGYGAAN